MWVKYKQGVDENVDYKLLNLQENQIEVIAVMRVKDSDDYGVFLYYFNDSEIPYGIFQGTNVECMRVRDELLKQLGIRVVDIKAW